MRFMPGRSRFLAPSASTMISASSVSWTTVIARSFSR
jgi:hypothetical protein